MTTARTVTRLLHDWRGGDEKALDELVPLVYDELRRLAGRYLRSERPDHTFRPTDLVSEAYLRLASGSQPELNDRAHFFAVAAKIMRRVLVDHARKRNAVKRVDADGLANLRQAAVVTHRPENTLALDDAMTALAKVDDRKARVIELHYFAGMSQPEIAEALGVHVNTIARDLRFAEAWIHRHLLDGAVNDSGSSSA